MVKRWKPVIVFALTFVLAVSLENEFFLFLLGFEGMVYAAALIQVTLLARRVRMRIVLPDRITFRGEAFQIRAELTNQSRAPIPQLMARVSIRVFPEREKLLMRGKLMLGSRETGDLCFTMDSSHCGCLEIQPNQLMITDYLGLAQRKCRVDTTETHLLFVLPENLKKGVVLPEEQSLYLSGEGEEERKGNTAMDVAEIRPYQPGDLIKLVHWKLSARLGELMVREMSDPATEMVRIYLNLQESDEKSDTRRNRAAWDQFMETVAGVSALLLEQEKKHVFLWLDAQNDAMVSCTVSDEESQQRMLCELLRAKTFRAKNYVPLIKEVYADEAQETILEIDLQSRIDRSAPR